MLSPHSIYVAVDKVLDPLESKLYKSYKQTAPQSTGKNNFSKIDISDFKKSIEQGL